MAENSLGANEGKGKLDWQAERKEMARLVRKNILDPFALVAGTLQDIELNKSYEPALGDMGRVLRLMVEGAHVELDLYCSPTGGPVSHPFSHFMLDAKEGAA
ncbi:MAG: hypothetical protein LBO64_06125 [Desulfovibrio sp.]|jgi:hypothetical protein|nr:hypothetical protein [Desulfovibrio sp.]